MIREENILNLPPKMTLINSYQLDAVQGYKILIDELGL